MAKKKKQVSLHELSDAELDKMFADHKAELLDLRFSLVTSSVQNMKKIQQLKRDVARVLTIKRERELKAKTQ